MQLEEREEERAREPDDVQIVALDPLDETSAEPLDRVPAGPALPLPALQVRRDELVGEPPERDGGDLVHDHVEFRAEQAEP